VEYYRARAGSIGTIIVECCFIDDYGLAFPGAIGIDNDEKIAGLAKIADAIKAEGSKAILQIYHGGRMVDPQLIGGRQPVAPSALAAPREGAAMPRALSGEEVEGMIAKFGDGVRRAILAGFDGVEIHGANTYLIQQFYSPNSNQRDDEWGGSRDNRAFPAGGAGHHPQNGPPVRRRCLYIGYRFSRKRWKSRVSALTTPCICWKNWRRAASIICTSPSARPCVRLLSIPAIRRR
jgi:fumarate reductase flavoprotein subunit